ncbi:MAG: hypothetical protein Q9163_001335 [Psora crenata]
MVQYKGSTITDYFKSYSQPRPQKQPLPSDGAGGDDPQKARPSSSSSSLIEVRVASHPQKCHSTSATNIKSTAAQDSTSPGTPVSFEPPLTQTSTIPGSQRIVKNGEVMIRNSDDESAGSVSSSLEDLDTILNKHREPSSMPVPKLPYLPTKAMKIGLKHKGGRQKANGPPSPVPERPTSTFSLEMLAKQQREYETTKEDIARARTMLEAQQQKQASQSTFPGDLLDEVMQDHGEKEDIDRLRMAINKTEALHDDSSWSFFDENAENSPPDALEIPSFKDSNLGVLLVDMSSWQQTFLSGLMEEYAKNELLPEDLLLCILKASISEPREDLRQAYANTLKEAQQQLESILTVDCLSAIFQKLGASNVALNVEEPVQPRAVISHHLASNTRQGLFSIVDLLQSLSDALGIDARIRAISLLCRLLLDVSVVNDGYLVTSIERTLTKLLPPSTPAFETRPHWLETTLLQLHHSTTSPSLRIQLLRNLPLLSREWLLLRRQLALSFFFKDPTYLSRADSALLPFSLPKLSTHLSTATFAITNHTDYATLTSSILTLDMAIDAADRPPTMTAVEERAFNDSIDALAAKIKSMFMQIIDSGASNLRRTEAKEVLEGLHSRLLYAVRTRPPPRKNIFGDQHEDYEGERKGMKAFVEAAKRHER